MKVYITIYRFAYQIFKVNKVLSTYIVEDAKLVSSCLSCPSSANPLLSLLLAKSGVRQYIFDSVKPGPTGQFSLKEEKKKM